ncbi:hypothetical protein BGP77_04475 [Saccharospirillum sp. MSK14-1]|nr:hypothetical protein BGP77_04475 [Saccharospirillum sp. MSK14-1]
MNEPAVVSQQQQAFGVIVQSTGGIDIRDGNMVRQGFATLGIGELAQDLERFVQENNSAHNGSIREFAGCGPMV